MALVAFVTERGAALYRYGYLLAGNEHDADDLVQEALLRVRARWSRVAGGIHPHGHGTPVDQRVARPTS